VRSASEFAFDGDIEALGAADSPVPLENGETMIFRAQSIRVTGKTAGATAKGRFWYLGLF